MRDAREQNRARNDALLSLTFAASNSAPRGPWRSVPGAEILPGAEVLLSGATGYLGVHLLQKLLDDKTCHVHVVVRGQDDYDARKRLQAKLDYYFGPALYAQDRDRIHVRAGQLEREHLGLGQDAWAELSQRVECIFHAAANVRHYGHYDEFFEANVVATTNLLELAKAGRPKRFHHISTTSVAYGQVEGKPHVLFTEYDCDVGQKPANYYIKTKLEAEKRVLEAREAGLDACIYRIGNITFDSTSGQFQENIEDNAFYRQVKAYVNLGVVPEGLDKVELSFVDQVTRSILALAAQDNLGSETWHIRSPHVVNLSDVLTAPALGLELRRLSVPDFLDFLYENHERDGFREHVEDVMLHQGWLSDDFGAGRTRFEVLQQKTDDVLARLDFAWPKVDAAHMQRMIVSALQNRIEFLGQTPLFSALSRPQLEALAGLARMEVYREDADILWEGHASDTFHVIWQGAVELSRHSRFGWLGLISIVGKGEFVGESGLFNAGQSSPVTAQPVLDDARVLSFRNEVITRLVEQSPQFASSLLRQMNERLRRLEIFLVDTA